MIVTLGLALLLNGLTSVIWGGGERQFNGPFSTRTLDVGGVPISVQDIGIVVVSFVLVALLAVFFRYTKLGLGMRAAALNPSLVAPRRRARSAGCSRSAGGSRPRSAPSAGMMVAPVVFLDPNMMQTDPALRLRRGDARRPGLPLGAVVGGLVLGLTIDLLGRYVGLIGSTLKLPVALALILVLLLVKPGGLFGRMAVRRV